MYVPLTGIRSSGDTVSYGDEWDMLLTVGNKGKGPTKQVSADVRPIPPPLGLDLGQILGLLSCTPKCNYTSNGVGGWFVRWPPLKPNTKQTYKIRFMVSTYQTGYVNIGVIVFEGTSTNVSSESPETKGYDGFQITIQ